MTRVLMREVSDLNLSIDENNLLNEWKGQAAMMLDYGIWLADAMQEEDESRVRLAIVSAELDRAIRTGPEAFGLAKVTESALVNVIVEQKAHQEATKALNDVHHDVRVLRAAVDAISQRKSALQGMTDLWLRQWYADPNSAGQPSELHEAVGGPPAKPPMRRVPRRGGGIREKE